MKYLLISFIFLFNYANSQCHIESFPHIIKFNKVLDSSIIKKSNCSEESQEKFIDFVSNIDGEMNSQHLSNIFQSEFKRTISFSPKKIKIDQADNFIQESLNLKEHIVKSVRSLYGNASLNLPHKNSLRVSCNDCKNTGEKNLKLINGPQQIWISAEFLQKRMAYSLKKDINPFRDKLSESDIETQIILDSGEKQLFQDYEHIKYYKANRILKKGQVLRANDLSPKILIKYNQEVEVHIKGEKVSLKSKAIARESGKFGQTIKLFNPKTKKFIQGKIIDFNKALIEI